MALDDLAHVHQLPQQGSCAGWFNAHDLIASFGGRQEVADRANAADARGDGWHLKYHAAFAKLLKTSKFIHMKISMVHRTIVIHVDGHFCVTLDAGHWINCNFLCNH